MAIPTHIYVTAPPGRVTPMHHDDAVEPGGAQLLVRPGQVRRVRYWRPDGSTSQTIRRSRNRGDLVLCNMDGTPVDSFEAAAASADELDGGLREITVKPTTVQLAEMDRVRRGQP